MIFLKSRTFLKLQRFFLNSWTLFWICQHSLNRRKNFKFLNIFWNLNFCLKSWTLWSKRTEKRKINERQKTKGATRPHLCRSKSYVRGCAFVRSPPRMSLNRRYWHSGLPLLVLPGLLRAHERQRLLMPTRAVVVALPPGYAPPSPVSPPCHARRRCMYLWISSVENNDEDQNRIECTIVPFCKDVFEVVKDRDNLF